MNFQLFPLLLEMKALYEKPRNVQRFRDYLDMMLNKDRSDIIMPITAFNPMAKELALSKIEQLINLDAEGLISNLIKSYNTQSNQISPIFYVAINLIDDVEGSWSNKFTTDFKNKFDFGSTFKRNFCLPCFWTSEEITDLSIQETVESTILRTLYWQDHGKPETLKEHFDQEYFVYSNLPSQLNVNESEAFLQQMQTILKTKGDTTDHNFIINFFYGDLNVRTLSYPENGFEENAGFRLVKYLTN